jgi:hypothetical protein
MRTVLLLLLALALPACIIQAPTAEGSQPTGPGPRAGPAPAAEVRVGANFGDKVELVSAILNPSRAVAGEPVHVILNFRVLDVPDRDWYLFVHIEDVDGRVERYNVDHPPRAKPTSQWVKGEVVRDEFDIPVPPGLQVRGINILLGFWDPKAPDQRLVLRNKESVRNDGFNRILLAGIPVAQQ